MISYNFLQVHNLINFPCNFQVVRRLISSGADPNTCSSAHTRDPALTLACSIPTVEARHIIMSLLLSKGASVDAINSVGQTALMRAVMAGSAETCALLLDASAKVGIEVSSCTD